MTIPRYKLKVDSLGPEGLRVFVSRLNNLGLIVLKATYGVLGLPDGAAEIEVCAPPEIQDRFGDLEVRLERLASVFKVKITRLDDIKPS